MTSTDRPGVDTTAPVPGPSVDDLLAEATDYLDASNEGVDAVGGHPGALISAINANTLVQRATLAYIRARDAADDTERRARHDEQCRRLDAFIGRDERAVQETEPRDGLQELVIVDDQPPGGRG